LINLVGGSLGSILELGMLLDTCAGVMDAGTDGKFAIIGDDDLVTRVSLLKE
jgi:hypothetical protein